MINNPHFVAVTNNNFAIAMLALIRSVKKKMPHSRFSVIQVCKRSVDDKWLELFNQVGANILWIDADPIKNILNSFPGIPHYGPETYTKFLLQDYLDEPFWWIDTDMLMQKSLTIPDSNLDKKAGLIIAPYHVSVNSSFLQLDDQDVYQRFAMVCNIDDVLSYNKAVNGGVIWMNPPVLRQSNFQQRALSLLSTLHPYLREADESILNLMNSEFHFDFLPEYIQMFVGENSPYPYQGLQPPVFHHYVGRTKPWMKNYTDINAIETYKSWLGEEWDWR